MSEMKAQSSVVVIGDVVDSRRAQDRVGLHERLVAVLAEAGARFGSDLALTVGDEYQGAFTDLGSALRATWWVQLQLLPEVDVRHGVGVGPVQLLDADTGIQDGPGWWAARAAIEHVEREAARPRARAARTGIELAPGVRPDAEPWLPALRSALLARDELTARLGARSVSLVRGLLDGMTQQQLAEAEGVSASAVSQRLRTAGAGTLLAVDAWTGELR